MKIQSLSVVVPSRKCINHCASCPSRMHDNDYPVLLDDQRPDFDQSLADYMKRLEYARDNGCNTLMLTGTSEPQQNRKFLTWFGMMMQMMDNPFRNIEMQCTGVLLDDGYIQFLRRHVGVNCMALSLFSLNDKENKAIIHPPAREYMNYGDIVHGLKEAGMAVRLCLNLTWHFDQYGIGPLKPEHLFQKLKDLGPDQVTFRVLYPGTEECPENEWVKKNAAQKATVDSLREYIVKNGRFVGVLPYGAVKYGIDGMSVVLDEDSMGKESEVADQYKYLILRPDCRLYSSWDDKGSLVF